MDRKDRTQDLWEMPRPTMQRVVEQSWAEFIRFHFSHVQKHQNLLLNLLAAAKTMWTSLSTGPRWKVVERLLRRPHMHKVYKLPRWSTKRLRWRHQNTIWVLMVLMLMVLMKGYPHC